MLNFAFYCNIVIAEIANDPNAKVKTIDKGFIKFTEKLIRESKVKSENI